MLKEKDWKQWNLTEVKGFLKPNYLVQISLKIENLEMSSWEPEN